MKERRKEARKERRKGKRNPPNIHALLPWCSRQYMPYYIYMPYI